MSAKDRQALRRKLLAKRETLVLRIGHLEDAARDLCASDTSGSPSVAPDHPADRATDGFEEELTLGLIENEANELHAIDHALESLRDGTYGVCEKCGRRIILRRLRAIPDASLCIECQRMEEEQSRPRPRAFSSSPRG